MRFTGSLLRAVSLTLILCLLLTGTPVIAQHSDEDADGWRIAQTFLLPFSEITARVRRWLNAQSNRPARQESQRTRDSRVFRIAIYPGNTTLRKGEQLMLTPVAFDINDNLIGGVSYTWQVTPKGNKEEVSVSDAGNFVAYVPGTYRVTAQGAGRSGTVTITVEDAAKTAQHHARPMTPQAGGTDIYEWRAITKKWADHPINERGNPPNRPASSVGGATSGNFQLNVPLVFLPGRGLDVDLKLQYNSRVWAKTTTNGVSEMTFDIDKGTPAVGWSFGFGKIINMLDGGAMIVDADGTRHGFAGEVRNNASASENSAKTFIGSTTDGTFIDYICHTDFRASAGSDFAEAKYPNGTVVGYWGGLEPSGARTLYPTTILDANGNYITITYHNHTSQNFYRKQIETITDTLGRVVLFNYDSSDRLTAITVGGIPDANGNPTTRTVARFHYKSLTLDYAFAPMQALVRTGTAPVDVLDAIYFPATATGYWFGDSDSYSSYGMIAKVEAQRSMVFSAASLNEQGTVTPGFMTRRQVYDYPLLKGGNLADAPDYHSLTETWENQTGGSAVTHFDIQQDASPRTVTVTYPDNSRHVESAYNLPEGSPGHANDGLIFKDELFDANNNLMSRKTIGWNQDVTLTTVNGARPDFIDETDETGTTRTEYTYSSGSFTFYDQITEERVYGYNGALVRKTVREYENGYYSNGFHFDSLCDYNTPRLISLVKDEKVYAGDGTTLLSRTAYRYDEEYPDAYPPGPPGSGSYQGALVNAPGVTHHEIDFNPYLMPGFYWQLHWIRGRANLTSIIRYPDPTSETSAITEKRRYDMTGNLVTQSTTCCEQINFVYESGTQYAYPSSQTRGAADPNSLARVTSTATYDFNTGLNLTSRDADGRETRVSYSPVSWRPETILAPTGATTTFEYDDGAIKITQTTRLSASSPIANQTIKLLNGLGLVKTQKALGANNTWDVIDTEYDSMARVSRQTRPYRSGDPSYWIAHSYDALGRINRITWPDGSTTETYYNQRDFDTTDSYSPARPNAASTSAGQTALVRDAWGRERWGRADSLGRLVEVVEPDPLGNGSTATGGLVTTYNYDALGRLLTTTQDAQTRSFKYDGLGRLTAQKLAERNATLDSQGQYVGASGTWSDVFAYDVRSNVIARFDARGVKTNFDYAGDPLNRLQSVSFDTTADPNHGLQPSDSNYYLRVLDAPTVTYQYRTKSNASDFVDVTKIATIITAGVSTEAFGYDTEGRLSSSTLTLNSRPYAMVSTYEYDALDRLTNFTYPAKDLVNQTSRKVVHHDYDTAGRVSELTVDSVKHASQFTYNAASQLKSLLVGPDGPNQITETYAYSDQTGLLDGQTVVRGAGTQGAAVLLDLTYGYADANGKRTGQLTKVLNNLNHNRDRGYAYDALGRLKQATGGPATAVRWTETYAYDRYGNRTGVTASGYSARLTNPGFNTAQMLAANSGATANKSSELPDWLRRYWTDPSSKLPTDSSTPIHSAVTSTSAAAPQSGYTFSDDPLQPGVTPIKAVHITELRDAVNLARTQAGLAPATWAEAVQVGTVITAAHILELRTQLDQARGALGLSPATYTPPAPSVGGFVLAVHVQELRDRVRQTLVVSAAIPVDGFGGTLAFDAATNRMNAIGFEYDKAGNETKTVNASGTQKLQYDAANRLVVVLTSAGALLASYVYGCDNRRLISDELNVRTYYAWRGNDVIAEYTEEGSATVPTWYKFYIFLGPRLLSTFERLASGAGITRHHHPDRLGTRLVTTSQTTDYFEQQTLPFGTALNAESTGETNRRFTSYDRSPATKLDYAINRHYDSLQGRFTQVDPIGLSASSLIDPQSLNLYAYVGNDPINRTDPDGQFWGLLFSFLKALFKSLKPNTVNVSFRYGNLAPFGASFSTNLQNISASYGPIGIQVRENGTWLPGVRDFLASISRSSNQGGGRGDTAEYKRALTEEEWKSLEPIFEAADQALNNPDCMKWITDDIKFMSPNPQNDLKELINIKHFFYGGSPGSYATTYSNGGFLGSTWIGLRKLFFRSGYWEKIETILHELRHASSLGMIAHPEQFSSEAAKVAWLEAKGVIETQKGFHLGVKKNCIDPLKKALRKK